MYKSFIYLSFYCFIIINYIYSLIVRCVHPLVLAFSFSLHRHFDTSILFSYSLYLLIIRNKQTKRLDGMSYVDVHDMYTRSSICTWRPRVYRSWRPVSRVLWGGRCTKFEVNQTNLKGVIIPAASSASSDDLSPDVSWRQTDVRPDVTTKTRLVRYVLEDLTSCWKCRWSVGCCSVTTVLPYCVLVVDTCSM